MVVDVLFVFAVMTILIVWYVFARLIPRAETIWRERHGFYHIDRPELNEIERLFHESEGPAAVERRWRELNVGPYPHEARPKRRRGSG